MKASEFLERFNSLVEVIGGDPEVLLSVNDTILEQAAIETQWCKQLRRRSRRDPKLWSCDFDQDFELAKSFRTKDVDKPMLVIKIW